MVQYSFIISWQCNVYLRLESTTLWLETKMDNYTWYMIEIEEKTITSFKQVFHTAIRTMFVDAAHLLLIPSWLFLKVHK